MDTTRFLEAAAEVRDAAATLARVYAVMEAERHTAVRAAVWQGGVSAGGDIIGGNRLARDFLAALLHAGFGPMFDAAGVQLPTLPPMPDFAGTWAAHIERGAFTTTRRRADA